MNIVVCIDGEERHFQRLKKAAAEDSLIVSSGATLANDLRRADIFCGHVKIAVDWQSVVASGRLKWIQSSAAGLDHCLTPPVTTAPVLVSSASGLFADQVAEHTLALLLGLLRKLPLFFQAAQQRRFERRPTDDLHGKSVGIVGLGGNGRRIVQLLAPFGVNIVATDVFAAPKPDVVQLLPANELRQLLQLSDIVVLCVPLTATTRGLIGAEQIAWMRPGSYLINVARGPVVQEAALVEALLSGQLAGAGLDVTEVEPLPAASKLWSAPNVIITPHVAAQSRARFDDAVSFFCANLRRYRTGQRLWNLVDKQLGFPRPADRAPDDWRILASEESADGS